METAPALNVPVPSEVLPSTNVTVPVGIVALIVDVTVAVNVMFCPVATLLAEAVNAVWLAARFGGTTCPTLFNSTTPPEIRSGAPSLFKSTATAPPSTGKTIC